MTPSTRNRLLLLGLTVLLVLGGVVLKIHLEGAAALTEARSAWDKGDMDRAQLLYLRAGRWYLPGGDARGEASERLLTLARQRMETHDWPGAVSAFDDVRALHYGSSSLIPAGGETLDAANHEMADALAAWKRASGAAEPHEVLSARYLTQLQTQDIPSPPWSLVMGLALLVWLGALGVLAWRYDDLRIRWPWLVAAGLGFALWVLSLHLMGP